MYQLTLIRHAKSSWEDPSIPDYHRPLNARGNRDLPKMVERVFAYGLKPDLFITSGANRAQTTARALYKAIKPNTDLIIDDTLYEASPVALLRTLQRQDNTYKHIAIIGHNPSMQSLIEILTGESLTKFPTCAVIHLALNNQQWSSLCSNSGNIIWFDYPKLHTKQSKLTSTS